MICGFDECGKNFEPHRHNQKYCCSECCKGATNKRTRQKYLADKKRLQGETRICSIQSCNTILSRYTEDDVCGKCLAQRESEEMDMLRRMFK